MYGCMHPFSKAVYEVDESGAVLITTKDGRIGRYRRDGSYLSGEVFDVDPSCATGSAARVPAPLQRNRR